MLDIAASHDYSNSQAYKRKRNSLLQEAPIDGRLENTSSSDVDGLLPKRKRMRLWERPGANMTKAAVSPVHSDAHVVDSSKKESKEHDKKNKLLNSHLKPVKETSVNKDKSLSAKPAAKSPNTKPRRTSQKLTVRMKFMTCLSKNVQAGTLKNQSSSQTLISAGSNDTQTSNGEASHSLSTCKLVSKQNSPHDSKQQSEHFSSIRTQISSAKSPASSRKHDSVLPRQNVVNGDESSMDIQWIPPQSPFNLVEESLFHSSWKILVASIILENGQGWLVSDVCQVY